VATGDLTSIHAAQGAVAGGGRVVEVTFTSTQRPYDELASFAKAVLVIIAGRL
jgi:hypothetical protein